MHNHEFIDLKEEKLKSNGLFSHLPTDIECLCNRSCYRHFVNITKHTKIHSIFKSY